MMGKDRLLELMNIKNEGDAFNPDGEPRMTHSQFRDYSEPAEPDFDDDNRPIPAPEGVGNFQDIDWKTLHGIFVQNREALNSGQLTNAANVGDLTDYDGYLSVEDLNHLNDWGLIYSDGVFPVIDDDQYLDYNTFVTKAQEIWEKDPPYSGRVGGDDSEAPYMRGYEPMSEDTDDVPLSVDDPDKLEKDLAYDSFRNGAYQDGAIETHNTNEYDQMFQEMQDGTIPLKKEYVYLKNKGTGAIILTTRIYENGWVIVNSVSQREKFPVVVDLPMRYGIYSQFVFPPEKARGAFDFVKMEKEELIKKGFHLYETDDNLTEQLMTEENSAWEFTTPNVEVELYNIKEKFHPEAEYVDTYRQVVNVSWWVEPELRDYGIKSITIMVRGISGVIEYEVVGMAEETKQFDVENFKWNIETQNTIGEFGSAVFPSSVQLDFATMTCIVTFGEGQ